MWISILSKLRKKSLKIHSFLSASRNIRTCVCSRRYDFLEEFFSTTRMQLWLLWQKVSAEWPHVLLVTSWRNCKSKRFSKKLLQGKFHWPSKLYLQRTCPKFSCQTPDNARFKSQKISVEKISQMIILAGIYPLDTKKGKLHGPAKVLPPKNRTKVLNHFFKLKISLKTFPRYEEWKFDEPAEKTTEYIR